MSGDLEDFLRRAAQRRQAKTPSPTPQSPKSPAQASRPQSTGAPSQPTSRPPSPPRQPTPPVAPKPRPEYTDRQAERIVRSQPVDDSDDIPVAILVEESEDAYAMQRRRIAAAKEVADKAQVDAATKLAMLQQSSASRSPASTYAASGNPGVDLIRMLRQPGGIQQAILLREIIERPEHRW